MAARESWKGHLKVADLACAVGLYTAISSSDRVPSTSSTAPSISVSLKPGAIQFFFGC